MPEAHQLPRPFAAQIDIAVFPAERLLDRRLLVHIERRRLRLVEDHDLGRGHLDLARGELWVLRPLAARTHRAGDLEDPLVPHIFERGMRRGLFRSVSDDLRDAVAIAQVDERDVAVIAARVHPAGEGDGRSDVGEPQLTERLGAEHPTSLGPICAAAQTRSWLEGFAPRA